MRNPHNQQPDSDFNTICIQQMGCYMFRRFYVPRGIYSGFMSEGLFMALTTTVFEPQKTYTN